MAEFYFELSANGEQTAFQEVEGVSTHVVLRNNLSPGDNPFKFRLPNLPNRDKVVLKKGQSKAGSKLLQWGSQDGNAEGKPEKRKALLTLKDAKGKALIEWTLISAYPVLIKSSPVVDKKSNMSEIENLELNFSFFTFDKK